MSEKGSHKQILRSSAIIGGSSIINIVIGLLRMKLVAVLLGPAGVGLIGILQNLMSTAATVSALGFGNVGTRQIAEAKGKNDQAAVDAARRALFWGTMILAVLGALLFWSASDLLAKHVMGDETLAGPVSWIAIGVALSVATGSQRALLTGMRRIGDIAKVSITSSLVSAVVGIGAVFWLREDGIVLLVIAAPLAGFVISHIYVARLPGIKSGPTPIKELNDQWRTLVRLGGAFMVAGLAVTLGQLAVRSMVQHQLGAESLGYFQAAWAISMTYIGFVLSAMGTDYYPRLTAAINDPDQANRLVNEQTEVAILLAGPVLLAMLALAPWVIQLLYTEAFLPAVTILRWQILGDVLKIISWPMGFIILASGKGTVFMVKEAAVIGIFVGVTAILLPLIDLEATGIAFFVMYVANVPLIILIVSRLTKFVWQAKVKRDITLLALFAFLIAGLGHYDDLVGALAGTLIAATFGIISFFRLAHMAELGGPIGRLIVRIKKVV